MVVPVEFGNAFLRVRQLSAGSPGAGQFTVVTGPSSPAGAGRDVLYGHGTPGTSYLIVRDETANVDYVQGRIVTHATERSLDDARPDMSLSDRTSQVEWNTDSCVIRLTVTVTGDSEATTRVSVRTQVEDSNVDSHAYQVQYLWDVAPGGDDAAVVQPRTDGTPYRPFDPTVGTERTQTSPNGHLIVADHGRTLALALSGADNPASVPVSVRYLCWPEAIFSPIGGYVTDPARDIGSPASTCVNSAGRPDSAVAFLWRQDAADGAVDVTASLAMSPPTPYATRLTASGLTLGSAHATLTDVTTGRPIPGVPVTFASGGRTFDTVITDQTGTATTNGLLHGVLGYDATYPGGAIWATSTAHGGLL
jgi:hypothetical protein